MTTNPQRSRRYEEARKVTLVGAVVDFFLGTAKIVIGLFDNSQALIADGVHSLSDLLTDMMVLLAVKHGSRDADDEHPYGHGRIETLMTVALGIILIAVAIGIAQDAIRRLFQPALLMHPGWFAFSVAAISAISKEALKRKSGARGLRSIMEKCLINIMYEIPSIENVRECVVNEEVVLKDEDPILLYEQNKKQA